MVLTPVWMVKAIFHLSRYNDLAAGQRSVILFSGAVRDSVERPRGDGLCKYKSCQEELILAECCTDSYARWRVKEQRRGKIRQATNCVALNPEGNHSNGCGLLNLSNLGHDGAGSFMAATQSHTAWIIFQQKASCFTWILQRMTLIV